MVFSTEIGWYVNTDTMFMEIYLFGPGSPYSRTLANIMSLNTWQYLGIVYQYETGKYKLMFVGLRGIQKLH